MNNANSNIIGIQVGNEEEKNVYIWIKFFFCLAWPDQSCPDNCHPLIELVENVEKSRIELTHQNQFSGPVVVHCRYKKKKGEHLISISWSRKQIVSSEKYFHFRFVFLVLALVLDVRVVILHWVMESNNFMPNVRLILFEYFVIYVEIVAEWFRPMININLFIKHWANMQERYHSQLDFVLFFLRLFFFWLYTYIFIYLLTDINSFYFHFFCFLVVCEKRQTYSSTYIYLFFLIVCVCLVFNMSF